MSLYQLTLYKYVRCKFIADGQLSYVEYTKYTNSESQLQHDLFNHFDTNKDGALQRSEYVDTIFSQMDHNGKW